MELDVRTNQLFMEILNNPNESSRSISQRLELTRSQLNYALKKLNEYLEAAQLEPIYRTKSGYFVLSRGVSERFKDFRRREQIDVYLSPEERLQLLILMLLSKTDFLSMNHFIIELNVSKNTVARDLKELLPILEQYELDLEYLRSKGYRIVGEEWNRRQLLFETIREICTFDLNELLIQRFGEITATELTDYQRKVEQVEQKLGIRYSDDKIKYLPIVTLLLHRRIRRGKQISYNFDLDYTELQETKEFHVIQEIFFAEAAPVADFTEIIYFTLLFLSTNMTKMEILSDGELSQLEQAVAKVIETFEKIAHTVLEDKPRLLARIMLHMRPAYYRIKYHMHLNEVDVERQKNKGVASVFYLVKQSLAPLEQFFAKPIPETEIFYLALFFGGHLLEHESQLPQEVRKQAIVVCTNGISISLLLERSLRGIFPEFDFVGTLSLREFYEQKMDADIVFSSVPLETDKQFYLVQDFLTDEGKLQLRKKVMNDTLVGLDDFSLAEKIVAVVKSNNVVNDEEALFLDVLNVLKSANVEEEKMNNHTIHFDQLISSSAILVEEQAVSWHQALELLAQPLMQEKKITRGYLQALKEEMQALPSYMVFRNRIGLPHTEPEKGALGVALSVGIFKQGVVTEEGTRIHVVVLLASNNKEKHIDALLELMDLSGREEYIERLLNCTDATQIHKILRSYRLNYWG